MTRYLISFDDGAMAFPEEELPEVDSAAHKVHIVVTVDRNCGFHSLDPNSVPKN